MERFCDFSSFEHQFALFSTPFTVNVVKAEENLQMELLEMQSDFALRVKYNEVRIPGFILYLQEKFNNLRKFSIKIMVMFNSIYGCELLFSFIKLTKTFQRTRLADEYM